MRQHLETLISEGKNEEGLRYLASFTKDATILQSRFSAAKQQYGMGLINYSEWSQIQSQINYAALEMMNKIDSVPAMVRISLLLSPQSFEEAVKSLSFENLHAQCVEAFKTEPVFLDKVYDLLEPINKQLKTGRLIEPGSVEAAKKELVKIFTEYIGEKNTSKKAEQLGDLRAIVGTLQDDVDEETLVSCMELLEIFFVSNPQFGGLIKLRGYFESLNSRDSHILRKMNRLKPKLNEMRLWIVETTNKIILNLES